ncbi:hypothetical protein DYB28_003262 [Aphanomyces astaci]|uniref:Crossover junction endonuclease MUS81-like HHH domain-containing protein n=1 Tax=Aphanomyces astaci TaxID=112090 RepID=A0A9X8HBJ9_APHAT|nr:hypothetical protein DYB28_003262 [Aphanomyces astaci]
MNPKSHQATAKKAVGKLLDLCKAEGVHVPTDPTHAVIQAGNILQATRLDGEYNLHAALKEMAAKYGASKTHKRPYHKKGKHNNTNHPNDKGAEESGKGGRASPKKPEGGKAAAADESASSDDDDDDESPGQKKREHLPATNPNNQPFAKLFVKLAGYEFKRGDRDKGIAHSNIATIIRDLEDEITSGEQAMRVRGIGPHSAAKIDEFLATGTVQELEDFRAGKL